VALPFARRDLDRLRLILAAQPKLREVHRSPRVKHLLAGRTYFADTLRWMEIHGGFEDQELVAHWRALVAEEPPEEGDSPHSDVDPSEPGDDSEAKAAPPAAPGSPRRGRRRRGRRRRSEGDGQPTPQPKAAPAASHEDAPQASPASPRRRRRRRGGRTKAPAGDANSTPRDPRESGPED
jgi:hypothetical protein